MDGTGPARKAGLIEDLLEQARAGDSGAEDELFRCLMARIVALAKKRIWDAHVAEDLAQETLETVFRKYREADLTRGLLPWVFTILHHKIGNHLKRRATEESRLTFMAGPGDWGTAGGPAEGPVVAFDLEESVEKALRRATPECRRIFRLLLMDATRQEMRTALGDASIGTMDSRISRCRRKLLQELERLWKERRCR